jgi:hypothetical protein
MQRDDNDRRQGGEGDHRCIICLEGEGEDEAVGCGDDAALPRRKGALVRPRCDCKGGNGLHHVACLMERLKNSPIGGYKCHCGVRIRMSAEMERIRMLEEMERTRTLAETERGRRLRSACARVVNRLIISVRMSLCYSLWRWSWLVINSVTVLVRILWGCRRAVANPATTMVQGPHRPNAGGTGECMDWATRLPPADSPLMALSVIGAASFAMDPFFWGLFVGDAGCTPFIDGCKRALWHLHAVNFASSMLTRNKLDLVNSLECLFGFLVSMLTLGLMLEAGLWLFEGGDGTPHVDTKKPLQGWCGVEVSITLPSSVLPNGDVSCRKVRPG